MISSRLIDFVNEHEHDDIHMLALHSNLYPEIDIQQAIQQIKGRKIAKDKIPSWYKNQKIVYPKHLSLEQCSSEQTACYKASLVKGNSMVDLTGGLGVDFSFLSTKFRDAVYVEKQSELTDIAINNFRELGLNNTSVVNADAIEYLEAMPAVDLIYIDPARRDSIGKKVVHIEDCTPNIIEIEHLLDTKAQQTMIKLSPILDITLALRSLSYVTDVYIISSNNECKELLFIKKKSGDELQYHCVNIHKNGIDDFSFRKVQEEDAAVSYATEPGTYLYEPNSSILKAGSYKYIAEYNELEKLHPNSHLYTSDKLHTDFQGRKFQIEQVCTLGKKDINKYLQGIKHANIATRNFPLSVAEIRKKTKLEDGGDIYIFATTLMNEKKSLLICKKAD